MVSDDRTRGQVILIGALSLAFIILGIVVVFNGVLYTETLSSVSSGQGVNDAGVTEQEIEHGIGCMLERSEDDEGNIEKNIEAFNDSYQNTTVQSEPAAISISNIDDITEDPNNATVTIAYDSADGTYTKTRPISEDDCP
ncbi:hypothetical protein ACFR99_14465 [Haloarchaeobius amylolyticus]|uniref:Uncharacterized protein n=1 Tax=Haloarchaeobius amylolyticus TaxID=1198296 RepID=A0ABD6BI33_9EURY